MFKYQQLIKENLSEIAKLITVEQVYQSCTTQAFSLLLILSANCVLPAPSYFSLPCRVKPTKMQKEM